MRRLFFAAILAFAGTEVSLSQDPDYTEEIMAKIRPLNPLAEDAWDRRDYQDSFRIYLRMWDECHAPIIRYHVIASAFRCINYSNVENGILLTDDVYSILKQCPAPLFNDRQSGESFALENSQYAMIQYALGSRANQTREFDMSEIYIARVEVFGGFAKRLDPSSETIRSIPFTQWVSEARELIKRNRGVETYSKTLGVVRFFFNGGEGRPDGLIRCPHCKGGDVLYEYQNFLGHSVWGSKPCIHCYGTGWVEGHRP